MNVDSFLSYGSLAIEAIILLTLIALCVRSEPFRKYAIVALGSLAPVLFLYISTIVAFVRDPSDQGARFAFYAIWIMGFVFFLACVGVAQLPRPTNLGLRYLLGASVTSGLFGLIALLHWSSFFNLIISQRPAATRDWTSH